LGGGKDPGVCVGHSGVCVDHPGSCVDHPGGGGPPRRRGPPRRLRRHPSLKKEGKSVRTSHSCSLRSGEEHSHSRSCSPLKRRAWTTSQMLPPPLKRRAWFASQMLLASQEKSMDRI